MKDFNFKELADNLFDHMISAYGLNEVVSMMISWGYSDDELYYLGFETETIEQAHEIIKENEQGEENDI